jgi:uroporphyrinogen III methyltransferase / synthase
VNPQVKNELTVAARDTPLARTQVREVMKALDGVAYKWVIPDAADTPDDLVCRGEANITIHEASSLPYPLREELALAALIKGLGSIESNAVETLPVAAHPLQGKFAVVCRADRADLRGLFFSIDIRRTYGKVWLVGAGPGSGDLLTLRSQRVMAKADVVYCDDLVDESLLSLCGGKCIYVGKRKDRASHKQDAINEKLYRSALDGRTVVRLKGGDPSIFGRAGEELEFLRRRWIPVETVPGITAASAAAAAGRFSLTQRRVSNSATFLSAHGVDGCQTRFAEKETIVYYMAASKLKEISANLIREGVPPQTPVALVNNAGAWNEACVSSTLEKMAGIVVPAPVLLVIGAVTACARVEKKALFTGIDPGIVKVPEPVVHQPLMAERRPAPLDLSYFSAVIFTSQSTVEIFVQVYGGIPDHLLCYVSNDRTRRALESIKVHPWRIVPCPVHTRGNARC